MRKILLAAFLILSAVANAQWNSFDTANNRITNVAATKSEFHAVPDGSGGMHIVWTDARNSATTGNDIFYQRILNNGTLAFDSAGVLVCNAAGSQGSAKVVPAAGGSVIVVWQDQRTASNNAIYGQKISSSGTAEWAANGVVVADATGNQNAPEAVSDGNGGAVVFFQDNRVSGVELYAQRINGSGAVQWAADGVAIATQANSQNAQTIIADGAGNYFLAWSDGRISNSNSDIFVQKLDNSGNVQWSTATQGVRVCDAANNQLNPQLELGPGGSVFVVWADLRAGLSNATDVYAHRVLSDGSVDPGFTANGAVICNAANNQTNPYMVSDGSGNVIITWADHRAGTATASRDIYAQKLLSNGSVSWAANGVSIISGDGFTQPNSTSDGFKIVSDGNGGAIIIWDDARNGTSNLDVYAQRINGSGETQWPQSSETKAPVAVGRRTTNQRIPVAVTDDANGAIVAWADSRNGTNVDIYASRLFADGTLPVSLLSFTGRRAEAAVQLQWEVTGEYGVRSYEVQKGSSPEVFSAIGSIAARNGNSVARHTYNFNDGRPASGDNYYRLRILEQDGSYSFSKVVKVSLPNQRGTRFTAAPNPALNQTQLQLEGLEKGQYALLISDASGRVILNRNLQVQQNVELHTLETGKLPSGIYRVILRNSRGEVAGSLSLQKQ